MKTVYRVEKEGIHCILFTIEDALYLIKEDIESNYSKEDESVDFLLTVMEMSDEEIENIGEFDGF